MNVSGKEEIANSGYGTVMELAQDTWFVHRSDTPILTFWKLEFP